MTILKYVSRYVWAPLRESRATFHCGYGTATRLERESLFTFVAIHEMATTHGAKSYYTLSKQQKLLENKDGYHRLL